MVLLRKMTLESDFGCIAWSFFFLMFALLPQGDLVGQKMLKIQIVNVYSLKHLQKIAFRVYNKPAVSPNFALWLRKAEHKNPILLSVTNM